MTADTPSTNGTQPAIEALALSKGYRLGEHRSLKQTLRRLGWGSSDGRTPELHALEGVDLRVDQGETVGIIGGNGSGKSTFLQMIAGITVPTAGSLVVRGRVLPLLAVGTGFHSELTGRENVTLFGASIGLPRKVISNSIERVGAFAGVEMHMDTPVKRYSSGMLSRLSFATAVLFPADIYLFDEVLALVDAEFQQRCLAEIAKLSEADRTVVFVSHDLDLIADTCDRAIWLQSGQLREVGSTQAVIDAYVRATAIET
jgi:ABC-type polysaccharide/polyol phosphate transport system ATPase subunit